MRKSLLQDIVCASSGVDDFQVYAHELIPAVKRRENQRVKDVPHDSINLEDDVRTGFIYSHKARTVYPIAEFVLSMLADKDADLTFYTLALEKAIEYAPNEYAALIQENLRRLQAAQSDEVAEWNKGEMMYYDEEVRTPEQKTQDLRKVRKHPHLHKFPERQKHLLQYVDWQIVHKVLEIGCGNASTLSRLAPPNKYGYDYIGTDISLQRLILAKMVIPEGDFVQCSALKLPFKRTAFSAIVFFGVLHHLIDPIQGLEEGLVRLAEGGYLILHEPIERPKLIQEDRLGIKRIFETYEHSEHDGEINASAVLRCITEAGMFVLNKHYSGSIVRNFMTPVIKLSDVLETSRMAWNLVYLLDGLFVMIFCKRINRLGPKIMYLVAQKSDTNAH